MCSCVRKKGGIILLDTLWDIVRKEMQTNPHWKKFAEEMMCLPWEEVMSVVQALTEPDPEGEQTMSDFFFKAPRGIQEPVWSRWQSVSTILYLLMLCDAILWALWNKMWSATSCTWSGSNVVLDLDTVSSWFGWREQLIRVTNLLSLWQSMINKMLFVCFDQVFLISTLSFYLFYISFYCCISYTVDQSNSHPVGQLG